MCLGAVGWCGVVLCNGDVVVVWYLDHQLLGNTNQCSGSLSPTILLYLPLSLLPPPPYHASLRLRTFVTQLFYGTMKNIQILRR